MIRNIFQVGTSIISTILLFVLVSSQWGPVPPLGPLLNPNSGFWVNAETDQPASKHISLEDQFLSDSIYVYVDQRQIPHIFASSDEDLYFAQGYITARDRLWQMEFQTRAAAGRLSEVLGTRTIEYDRYQRRIGMGYAAEQALNGMMKDPETAKALKAYASGINARIDELEPGEYPLEYKILDYAPEPWTPLKTTLLLKYMTYTLAGSNHDLRMSNTRAFFGDRFIKNVLDIKPSLNDPVIPPGTPWKFDTLSVQKPDSEFTPDVVKDIQPFQSDPRNGSNNWAVSGSKTASGYPILANDPHLNMSLPSIWYAIQLHSPEQNVMGVSLPGAPAVVVGFNENVAWGTTNAGADVWDWYEVQFRDSTLAEYRYNNKWKSTEKRIEKIKVKGKKTIVDTVYYTHHGPLTQTFGSEPMQSNIPKYHAMRWIAFEESNELKYFFEMNKATNLTDYQQALNHFQSPAQNWIFADSSNIAITVAGKYPLKWDQQGRYISDGSDPRYDWQRWIPHDQIPTIKNPERGFVSSANQDPTDGSYPYYLDDDFAPFERGRRINDRLAAMDDITPKDMQQLQMDTYNYHAKTVLPILLKNLRTDTLSETAQKAFQKLKVWNLENNGDRIAPSLFAYWWDAFDDRIWADEYESTHLPLERPARDQTVQLIKKNPASKWIDDINTSQKENLAYIVNKSFHTALQNLEEDAGPFSDGWQWGYVNNTNMGHVARIPGLGKQDVFTDGGESSINATRGSHGPSWRMVVTLGPEVKAYGVYPGGQSGNPGSRYYDNMIDDWANGELYPLWFMRNKPSRSDSVAYSIILK